MSQVIFTNSTENMPLFQNSLTAPRKEETPKSIFSTNISSAVKDTATSFYNRYFTWEYFSNELEYE